MSKEVKKSPIFYMGNKERLIKKGLLDLFPSNINTFWDLFCGSGIVSINVQAKKYIMNDYNKTIIELLNYFAENESDEIINNIKDTINKFQLLKGFNKRDTRETEEYKKKAQEKYNEFRNHYNTLDKSIHNLYVLSYYCNNNNIRFNKSGGFNMPIGNQYFNEEKHSEKIKSGCNFFKDNNVTFYNEDFRGIDFWQIEEGDFVYLDPPYTNTLAIYNEQQGWGISDDEELFAMIERDLDSRNIKWAMSNVFKNKGVENTHLIEWVNKRGYKVHYFDGFTYVSCGKGNAETVEVLITNY